VILSLIHFASKLLILYLFVVCFLLVFVVCIDRMVSSLCILFCDVRCICLGGDLYGNHCCDISDFIKLSFVLKQSTVTAFSLFLLFYVFSFLSYSISAVLHCVDLYDL